MYVYIHNPCFSLEQFSSGDEALQAVFQSQYTAPFLVSNTHGIKCCCVKIDENRQSSFLNNRMECLIQTEYFMRAKGMKSCWDHRTKVLECCWAKRKQKLPEIYFQTIEWNATFKENMKHKSSNKFHTYSTLIIMILNSSH